MAMTFQTTGLGLYTFAADPTLPLIRKRETRISGPTWGGSKVKDRGARASEQGLIGLILTLEWPIMSASFYASLKTYYEYNEVNAGAYDPVIFDPKERARVTNEKYKVKIVSFYWPNDHFLADYIMSPKMVLNIRGVI